jgi:nucleolar protein 58
MVATKAALSIRVDALTDAEGKSAQTAPSIGLENRAKLEYRLRKLEEELDQTGVRKFNDKPKNQKKYEPQGDFKVYNTAADLVPTQRESSDIAMESVEVVVKEKRKEESKEERRRRRAEKKAKKEARTETDSKADEEEDAMEVDGEAEKPKRKKRDEDAEKAEKKAKKRAKKEAEAAAATAESTPAETTTKKRRRKSEV